MNCIRWLKLIPILLLVGCKSQRGEVTMADLVQTIAAHTKDEDWSSIVRHSINPEAATDLHRSLSLEPSGGGLRSWTFRPGNEVSSKWIADAPYRGLELSDHMIVMSWTVPAEFGVENVDVFYSVVRHEDRYCIRFLKIKEP